MTPGMTRMTDGESGWSHGNHEKLSSQWTLWILGELIEATEVTIGDSELLKSRGLRGWRSAADSLFWFDREWHELAGSEGVFASNLRTLVWVWCSFLATDCFRWEIKVTYFHSQVGNSQSNSGVYFFFPAVNHKKIDQRIDPLGETLQNPCAKVRIYNDVGQAETTSKTFPMTYWCWTVGNGGMGCLFIVIVEHSSIPYIQHQQDENGSEFKSK